MKKALLCALAFCLCQAAFAASVITTRLDDPKAVYVEPATAGQSGATGADSSAALQAAIDKAVSPFRGGIVFVREGRYAITRTIYLWPGVRLFGYGADAARIRAARNTPGFQKGVGVMVMFTGARTPADPEAGERLLVPIPPPDSVPPKTRSPTPTRTRSTRR